MAVPFVGRLDLIEYLALVVSFLFIILEKLIRVVTLALPGPIINFCYNKSRSLFNTLSATKYTTVASSSEDKSIVAKVRDADGFVDLCELWNDGSWRIEEHVVQTTDGYLLGVHRIVKIDEDEATTRRRSARWDSRSTVSGNEDRKVVYLHHGLLMNSEVWVCQLEKEKSLPFVLAEKGFDVWLGNNRGNKYSKKSIHHPASSDKFWDFSIDDFAFYDIPDSINYILETTKQKTLSYIGFSQGTAQAFASLSIHPKLNEKVDVFIALAPAMSPAGLYASMADALMKASPNLMYLFFGRRSILSSTTFWQSILYPPIFVRVIDACLGGLFNWRGANISLNQKIAAYAHLYSYTSVKSVVHWFQIMRNRCFQMFDDEMQTGVLSFTGRSFYKVARFPTKNITTPIVLVYGGSDSLVDINIMLKELPAHTTATEIPHFEHLDFLWADHIDELVFPHVLNALEKYTVNDQVPFGSGSQLDFRQMNLDIDLLPESATQRVSDQQAKEVEESLEAAVLSRLAQNAALSAHEKHRDSVTSSILRHRHTTSLPTYSDSEAMTLLPPPRTPPGMSQREPLKQHSPLATPIPISPIHPLLTRNLYNPIRSPSPTNNPFSPSLGGRIDTPPPPAPNGFHYTVTTPPMSRQSSLLGAGSGTGSVKSTAGPHSLREAVSLEELGESLFGHKHIGQLSTVNQDDTDGDEIVVDYDVDTGIEEEMGKLGYQAEMEEDEKHGGGVGIFEDQVELQGRLTSPTATPSLTGSRGVAANGNAGDRQKSRRRRTGRGRRGGMGQNATTRGDSRVYSDDAIGGVSASGW